MDVLQGKLHEAEQQLQHMQFEHARATSRAAGAGAGGGEQGGLQGAVTLGALSASQRVAQLKQQLADTQAAAKQVCAATATNMQQRRAYQCTMQHSNCGKL